MSDRCSPWLRRPILSTPAELLLILVGPYSVYACEAQTVASGLEQARAQAISRAASEGEPQSAVLITGLDDDALASVCATAQRQQPGAVCQIAARMYPGGRVVAGHEAAVTKASTSPQHGQHQLYPLPCISAASFTCIAWRAFP